MSQPRPAPPRRRTGWRRAVPTWRGLLITGLLGVVVLAGLFVLGYVRSDIPAANAFATSESSVVRWADGKELGRYATEDRESVTLEEIPDTLERAVVAAEDRTFYDNRGVDPVGIARAAWTNLRAEGAVAGGSTITQQYVKNYYLSHDRTWSRKIDELFIALKIDQEKSKDQILEDYLNTIYFGRGAYGVQTAAKAYFGKSVSRLDTAESATLAAILQSPGLYDPAIDAANIDRLQNRFDYVTAGMVEGGWLSAEEAAGLALPEIKEPRTRDRLGGPRGFLLESVVRKELLRLGFTDAEIQTGGLTVTTTFDRTAQAAVEKAVKEERPTENGEDVHIGVASVRPGTGELVAMYGGQDYVKDSRNWALTGRQPGSAFKPFALAGGLSDGFSLRSRFAGNSPFELPGGTEVNNEFDNDYGRSVDLVKATEDSINTAYVDLTMQMGPDKVVDTAVDLGVPANAPGLEANGTITLGTADVSPVEMAESYATFAAEGEHADWFSVAEVRDRSGSVVFEAAPAAERVLDADVASDVSYALQRVVTNGTGSAAQDLDRPAAGKTGTAALRPDTVTSAWFVGYTPQLSTAVMYVRGDEGTQNLDGVGGLSTFFGGEYPARTWTAAMAGALEGEEVLDFPEPAFVGRDRTPETLAPPPAESTADSTPESGEEPTPTPTTEPTPTPTPTPTVEPIPTPTPTAPARPTTPATSPPASPPPPPTPTPSTPPSTPPPTPATTLVPNVVEPPEPE